MSYILLSIRTVPYLNPSRLYRPYNNTGIVFIVSGSIN